MNTFSKPICAGNWKMNKSPDEARVFVKTLLSQVKPEEESQLVLLVPALCAFAVAEALRGRGLHWGGQNCHFESNGAFTGENSPQLLKELGASFCIVGHSERRQLFGEQDDFLAKKVRALQQLEMTPILCVGETLDDRKWGRTNEVILRQLRQGLAMAIEGRALWVAYEPVWAIGTGQVATNDQVQAAHAVLRKDLSEHFRHLGQGAAAVSQASTKSTTSPLVPILYGGSVKPENAKELGRLVDVDGFLIGGASLDPNGFLQIKRNV